MKVRKCSKCRTEPTTGDSYYCATCRVAYQKDYYQKNKAKRKENARRWNERRVKVFRNWVNELKSRPCVDCNGRFPPVAMDFDHRENKTMNVSSMIYLTGYSKERILEEISKCDLVCANCHRVRTAIRSGWMGSKLQGSTSSA